MSGSDHKGLSGGSGSELTVSNAAPAIQPSVSAFINADSSTTPQRAILIRYACFGSDAFGGLRQRNTDSSINSLVSRVSGVAITT